MKKGSGDNSAEALLKIGELSKKAGLTERTLRYYEELGLLSPASVTSGGFRLYHPSDLRRVQVIKVLKELGLSLSQIKEVVAPLPGKNKSERLEFATRVLHAELSVLDKRIEKLSGVRDGVRRALDMLEQCESCPQEPCPPGCPNLEAHL